MATSLTQNTFSRIVFFKWYMENSIFFSLNCFHNAAATDIDQKLQQRIEKETHTVYRHTHTTSTRTHSAQNNALIKILFSTKSEITPSRYEN